MTVVRILVIHPGAELYGADRVMLETAAGLCAAGHDVLVALPEHGPLAAELKALGAKIAVGPMFVLRKELLRPRNWVRLLTSAVTGFRAGWQLISRHRPQVAYVSTIVLPQWPLLLRLRRITVVTHVHEAESASAWIVRATLYAPQLWSHAIIANSRFTGDLMTRTIRSLQRRIRVIHNPVPGPPHPTAPRPSLDGIRIGYVGRLSPRKGPAVVVQALAILRARGLDARLSIVGDVFRGYEWFADELAQQIDELGLADAVTRYGYEPDVWPHIAASDVMVVPSLTDESFGNTAVEAVLAERPVIVSDLQGLREAVELYPTTRITPGGDAVKLADTIEAVADAWPEIVGAVPAAAADARTHHSVQRYRDALVELIEIAAARRKPGTHADIGPV